MYVLKNNFEFFWIRNAKYFVQFKKLIKESGADNQSVVSYPFFVAFLSLLNNMELIKKIYLEATCNHPNREITKSK